MISEQGAFLNRPFSLLNQFISLFIAPKRHSQKFLFWETPWGGGGFTNQETRSSGQSSQW
jgi:hypothetical protein